VPKIANREPLNDSTTRAELMEMAEQQLAAFLRAVTESFGSKQAEFSAEDWFDELEAIHHLPLSEQEWRLLSIHAAGRIATRLNCASGIGSEGDLRVVQSNHQPDNRGHKLRASTPLIRESQRSRLERRPRRNDGA
jgi:hypothetical protein